MIRSVRDHETAVAPFLALLDGLEAVVYVCHPTTFQLSYISGGAERMLGYPRERWLNEPGFWASILHPDDRDATLARCREEIRALRDHQVEYRAVAADGRILWIQERVTLVLEGEEVVSLQGVLVDVTERKGAEEDRERLIRELEVERGRLARLFDRAPAYICTLRGPNHVFEIANPLYRLLTGGRDLLGLPVREALPEIAGQGLLELLDHVYRTGERYTAKERPITFEAGPGRLEDGWYDFVYEPLTDAEGAVTGIFVHGVDVTHQVRARQELAASEAHYHRLVENSPYPVFALDKEGRFRELNAAAVDLLGRPAAVLLGRHFGEVVAVEDLPAAMASFTRTIQGNGYDDVELRLLRADGSRRLVHVRGSAVEVDGVRIGAHGVARDITEERARDERAWLLASALEGLEEGVSIFDAEGRLAYSNSSHARLYGYMSEQRSALRVTDFITGPDPESDFAALIAHLRATGHWSGRAQRRRIDGEELPVHAIMGRVEGVAGELYLVISRDISQELVRERHLQRAERLASLGTLLSGVAHELNNPLHAIGNFVQLLLMEPRGEDDREALETVQRESDRASKIVSDLRVVARRTQDPGAEKDMVNLNEVVRQVLKLRQYTLETHDIRTTESLMPSLPEVWASRSEVEQVVLNLLLNAQQAMTAEGAGGTLSVRTSSARGKVLLQVSDTGPGIPDEIRERIFDPFFTTKEPGEGTGLGLSLAHSIVHDHGGDLRVASRPGEGTTFTLELPCAPEQEARGPAPELAPSERSLRVLVVDDEASIRRSMQLFLARRGHHVDVASSGRDALERLGEDMAGYHVILSDLRMPELGGEQLLQRLKLRGDGLERRLVLMTGDAASRDAIRAAEATGTRILLKPVDLGEVARAVEAVDGESSTS